MTDYRLALFEPGLSPGQRRLLFDLAVEEFHLPLPPACSSQPNAAPLRPRGRGESRSDFSIEPRNYSGCGTGRVRKKVVPAPGTLST
jgi:hypothetical protein